MFQALNQILSTGWFSLQLRRALGGPSEVGGFGKGQEAVSTAQGGQGERSLVGRHHQDFFLGTASQGKLSCTLFGRPPTPSSRQLEEEDAWDHLFFGMLSGRGIQEG